MTGGGTSGDVTLTLATPVSVVNGGTGASSASAARANLGAAASGANSDITSLNGLTTAVSVAQGSTGATTAAAARTNLGAAANGANSDITSLTGLTTALTLGQGGTGATTASGARTNLGLGTIATQDANNVAIAGGSITGITDLAIADGGTGASGASGARTNLGAASSGANSDITSLSSLTTPLSIAQGGTGASTASGARANLINCMPIGGSELTSRNATFQIATFGAGATSGNPDTFWPAPVSATVNDLQARVAVAPGTGNSWTVTLRKNGTNTSLSCVISGAAQSCSGSAAVSVAAADRLGVQFTEGGSATGTSGASWGACFVPN